MIKFIVTFVILLASNCVSADDKDDIAAALDTLHKAEANADITTFLSLWGEDAVFIGTDASEAWSKSEFSRDISKRFSEAGGWTFKILERVIGVDGNSAWFKEIVRYTEKGFILRPTGTMIKRNGHWLIVQLTMGVPIPNDVYTATVQGFMADENGDEKELRDADDVLDKFHLAAAKADWKSYFDLYTEDAVFIGTDVNERWTIDQFKEYASPTKGWLYTKRQRHMGLAPAKNVIWFDEILDNKSYGTTRGSGLLVRTSEGWKVMQYRLGIPVPNDLAKSMTYKIKLYETKVMKD